MERDNNVHIRNILLKLVINTALVVLGAMLFSDATFLESLLTGVVLTVVAYLLGDMMVLPKTNNITATVSDAVLGGLILWAASALFDWGLTLSEIVVIAVLLGVLEYIFHIRLLRTTFRTAGDRSDHSVLS